MKLKVTIIEMFNKTIEVFDVLKEHEITHAIQFNSPLSHFPPSSVFPSSSSLIRAVSGDTSLSASASPKSWLKEDQHSINEDSRWLQFSLLTCIGAWPIPHSGSVQRGCCEWYILGRTWLRAWADIRNIRFHPKYNSSTLCWLMLTKTNYQGMVLLKLLKKNNLIITFLITVTWPRYPALPLSTRVTPAARHSRLTWLRASTKSKNIKVLIVTEQTIKCYSCMKCCHFMQLVQVGEIILLIIVKYIHSLRDMGTSQCIPETLFTLPPPSSKLVHLLKATSLPVLYVIYMWHEKWKTNFI